MRLPRGVFVLFGLAVAGPLFAANWILTGALGAHDPTLLKDGTVWWCFTTGAGLPVKFSSDGLAWQQRTPLFTAEDAWWRTYAPAMGQLDVWAPDLHAYNGRVWCYYCVSEFGRNNSAIGLMSCTSIATGDWRDDGMVISSKQGTDSFNAIDPNLTIDALGRPWLVFGSWFDGIHLVPLDPTTMKPSGPISSLAQRANGIEGANVVYANGYYYLFVSIDRCCMGVNSTYKIAYGRATTITGPYVDKSGVPMLNGGCTVLDAGDSRWIGPGGQDVSQIGNGWVIARHAYDAANNGAPTLLISDLYWDADHWPTDTGPSAPTITAQPVSVTAGPGTAVSLSVGAAGDSLTYQWKKDGAVLAGSTAPTLTIANAQASDAGRYTVDVANPTATVTSRAATVLVATPLTGRLINLSVRTLAGTADQTLTAGFVISGSGSKSILVRGSGPTLTSFGLSNVLPDPHLDLFLGSSVIASNDSWTAAPNANAIIALGGNKIGTVTLDDRDTALLQSISAQGYTAQIRDAGSGQGLALVEVFDEDPGSPGEAQFEAQPRLINVSARAQVGTGPNVLIAGFIINGNVPRRVLIRGIGPTLANFGVGGVLADPQLTVFDVAGNIIAQNDNWPTAENRAAIEADNGTLVGTYSLDERDAVLLLTLPPGGYTAQVNGAGGTTGVALVDVSEAP
ncbi:MAG TPA: family 43 glycosylhydrolase [Opitutaceae bacterium]|nr:family 43 glycosylhydrolase [Opitutaceae bacterium]